MLIQAIRFDIIASRIYSEKCNKKSSGACYSFKHVMRKAGKDRREKKSNSNENSLGKMGYSQSHHGSSAPNFSLVVKSSMQSFNLKKAFFWGLYSMLSCLSHSWGKRGMNVVITSMNMWWGGGGYGGVKILQILPPLHFHQSISSLSLVPSPRRDRICLWGRG